MTRPLDIVVLYRVHTNQHLPGLLRDAWGRVFAAAMAYGMPSLPR